MNRNVGLSVLQALQEAGWCQLLLNAKKLLKTCLGSNYFGDNGPHVGRFREILETRPYMRVFQAQVRMFFESGDYKSSAQTIIEILRLGPRDNMRQRSHLGPILCRLERYSDALYLARPWMEDFIVDRKVYMPPFRDGTVFKAPERRLFSPEVEKNLGNSPCSMTYTAARAAFKLWGDCEESRQSLRIASKGNPHVIVKVLGKIKRPNDVWNWANEHPDAKGATFKKCGKPYCTQKERRAAEFQQCSSCHLVSYCGQACQKDDWKRHKPDTSSRFTISHSETLNNIFFRFTGKSTLHISLVVYRLVHAPVIVFSTEDVRVKAGFDSQPESICVHSLGPTFIL
ncbi:uncharacterized protein BT62DRAFT_1010796 [Guyanagaster necrorhizus]|uniref:MYND-type domain-containing protein n=1 Tax=Guyanagaster necrorhizus TaxID=856835 RepID=A0A9P7VLB4_9AGAR|nr:uncharacterized protein BT62DRAFT_1010796 [Guyanagaster necrorhizus MCA 3950]KAG7442019.1 hypothetical protein BT62DRAFT_1010796 [Guyanagaster necrorhizus MCA 3950]